MSGAHVFIDRSQFPQRVRHDLLESLRTRAINHKFHYESYKQAAKWLALHDAYSPARTDPSCSHIYDEAFLAAARKLASSAVHVVGLGCGSGRKEARLLELLRTQTTEMICTLSDVSLPLVLTARDSVSAFTDQIHSIVCDLATVDCLSEMIDAQDRQRPRIVTLFGIMPNFEPAPLLSRISLLLRPSDSLLLSANLSPGADYSEGLRKILPQYDNALTRDWLMTLLLDLGFDEQDGELKFAIEADTQRLQRIAAHFELRAQREIQIPGERILFQKAERIRVFFSYRHTLQTLNSLLAESGIRIHGEWVNSTGEEGVFLCSK